METLSASYSCKEDTCLLPWTKLKGSDKPAQLTKACRSTDSLVQKPNQPRLLSTSYNSWHSMSNAIWQLRLPLPPPNFGGSERFCHQIHAIQWHITPHCSRCLPACLPKPHFCCSNNFFSWRCCRRHVLLPLCFSNKFFSLRCRRRHVLQLCFSCLLLCFCCRGCTKLFQLPYLFVFFCVRCCCCCMLVSEPSFKFIMSFSISWVLYVESWS